MSDSRRIPTPFIYRWRRFCYSYVPVMMFAVCMLLTLKLWHRQAQMGNGVGAVEASNYTVMSSSAGTVLKPTDTYWKKHDVIQEGDIVCTLNNDLFLAKIETLAKSQEQLVAEIQAKQAELGLSAVDYDNEDYRDLMRIETTMQQLRLEQINLLRQQMVSQAQYETAKARADALQEMGSRIAELETQTARLESQEAITAVEQLKLQVDKIEKEMEQNSQWASDLRQRKGQYGSRLQQAIGNIVKPIEKSIDVLEAQIKELEVEQKSLTIRSPVSGVVLDVPIVPGHAIQAGAVLMTIASSESMPIISYVRQDQRIEPYVNMKVKVRSRFSTELPVETHITQVGHQHVPIPLEQLRDPTVPEWGLPVWIQRPPNMVNSRPGEMLDIIYPNRTPESARANPVSATRDAAEI